MKNNINKTWVLIAVLIVLTALLLVLSVYSNQKEESPAPTPTPEISKEITFATLKISENPRISSVSGRYEVDVDLTTEENKVTIIQLEMEYDPNTLRIFDIESSSVFENPEIIEKEIDTKNGTIKYWIAVNEEQDYIQGENAVAKITFTKIGTGSAEIGFKPKTSINALGATESVLKEMISGVIDKLPTPSPRPTRIINPTIPPTQEN